MSELPIDTLPFVPYNTSLTGYAKGNRKSPTKTEWIFWNVVLKNKQFRHYKFRRQHVVHSFILDFYCPQLLLWIEIDGGYHNQQEQQVYDAIREDIIKDHGITIIRFTNEEIETNLKWVVAELKKYITEITKSSNNTQTEQ
jgi:very-short-patch-repair endonuclease